MGSGRVGRAVASDTKDLLFEYSHRQIYLLSIVLKNLNDKMKIKKQRTRMAQLKNELKSPPNLV